MRTALIGATGYVGRALLEEGVARGHSLTAIARNVDGIEAGASRTPLAMDVADGAALAAALRGHEVVIVSLKTRELNVEALLTAIRGAGSARLMVVGGAGSLEVAPGLDLVDSPRMQPQWKPDALAARDFLRHLRDEPTLDWTMLSPSAVLAPGERTGRYRIGLDALLYDAEGRSQISLQDLAVAMWGEIERPRFRRERFTVGY